MSNNRERYRQMEKYMTIALLADAVLFTLFLLFAGLGIVWLKVLTAAIAIVLSLLCLAYLFLTKELAKRRSLWMSVSAGAVLVCIIASLILNYPSVSPLKDKEKETAGSTTACVPVNVPYYYM